MVNATHKHRYKDSKQINGKPNVAMNLKGNILIKFDLTQEYNFDLMLENILI